MAVCNLFVACIPSGTNERGTMKQFLRNKHNRFILLGAAALVILAFQCFFNRHYSIDAFSNYASGDQDASVQIQSGRFFYWIVVSVINRLHLSLIHNNVAWVVIFLCVLTASITILTIKAAQYFSNDAASTVLVFLSVCLSFVHAFMAEWFQFTEAILMYSFAVLGAVLAVAVFPLHDGKYKVLRYFLAFLFLNISYNSYQIGINYFVFYILCFILLENKNSLTKNGVKSTLLAAGLVVLTFALNLAISKILIATNTISAWSRVSTVSVQNIFRNLTSLLSPYTQKNLWLEGNGMFKAPDLLLILLIGLSAAIYALKRERKAWYDVLFVFILLAGGELALVLPLLLVDVFWMPPRTIVPLFCMVPFFLWIAAKAAGPREKSVLVAVLALFLLRQAGFIQDYSADVRLSNRCDKIWTEYIDTEIENYEHSNQLPVTQIAFLKDDAAPYFWEGISYHWDVCHRAVVVDWARNNMLKYYTGRDLAVIQPPDHIKEYFLSNAQGDGLLDTHVYFEDDVCYVYIQ